MARSSTTQRQKRQNRSRNPGPSPTPGPAPSPSAVYNPVPVARSGGMAGHMGTTRYWDCAKPACGYVQSSFTPARSCDKSGVNTVDPSATSGAGGGDAYTCNSYAPWSVSDTKSYGFAAFGLDTSHCCKCFDIKFTTTAIAGKTMTIQVLNLGSSAENGGGHFDLQMPGGGIGMVNGCTSQWGPNVQWGNQFGGLTSNTCSSLPGPLQAGCKYAVNSSFCQCFILSRNYQFSHPEKY